MNEPDPKIVAPQLVKVIGPPFKYECLRCRNIYSTDAVIAFSDPGGAPWRAYFCHPCAVRLALTQDKKLVDPPTHEEFQKAEGEKPSGRP